VVLSGGVNHTWTWNGEEGESGHASAQVNRQAANSWLKDSWSLVLYEKEVRKGSKDKTGDQLIGPTRQNITKLKERGFKPKVFCTEIDKTE